MGFPERNAKLPNYRNKSAYEIVRRSNEVLLTHEVELEEAEWGVTYYDRRGKSEKYLTPQFKERIGELQVPLAQQIMSFSAHRVAGNQGLIVTTDQEESEKWLLDLMRETNFNATLICGMEYACAYGGVYLRPTISDMGTPHLTVIRPDFAEPTWSHGRLKEVVLRFPLRKQHEKEKDRYVLYEYHHMVPWALNDNGQPVLVEGSDGNTQLMSVIDYRLYKTKDLTNSTGIPVPLGAHEDTVHLGELPTNNLTARRVLPQFNRVSVEYVPNLLCRPGSTNVNEGRSDFEGIYDLLDKYNLAWTTVIDELDIGRARILASPSAMQSLNDGRSIFDSSNRIFTTINFTPDMAESGIQQIEFNLQTQSRLYGVMELKVEILELAGWSPQSFGEHVEASVAESGTAKEYREQQTRDTVEAKRSHLINPARRILQNLCMLGGLGEVAVEVKFPQQNVLSDKERTDVAVTLYQNGLATRADMVSYWYPDLSPTEVKAKVVEIENEEKVRLEQEVKFQDMRKLSPEDGGSARSGGGSD